MSAASAAALSAGASVDRSSGPTTRSFGRSPSTTTTLCVRVVDAAPSTLPPVRLLRNPHVDAVVDGTSPHPAPPTDDGLDEPLALHRRIPGYAPSALVEVAALADRTGLGRVFVKHEAARFGLPAFKVLGASWAAYRLLDARYRQRHGTPAPVATFEELREALGSLGDVTLVTATDGNHGRAVARAAAWFGAGADIYVPRGTVDARIAAIESEGARVTVVDGDYDAAVATAAASADDDRLVVSDTSWPGYADVPAWIAEGYRTMFAELDAQLELVGVAVPDAVVVPVGVGALLVAAIEHWPSAPPAGPARISVEPLGADCLLRSVEAGEPVTAPGPHRSMMAGMNCGTVSMIAWPVMAAGTDWAVAIPDEPAAEAMRLLAAEGLVVGETGAGAPGALLALAAVGDAFARMGLGADSSVVCICTEGATDPVNYEAVVGRAPEAVAALR